MEENFDKVQDVAEKLANTAANLQQPVKVTYMPPQPQIQTKIPEESTAIGFLSGLGAGAIAGLTIYGVTKIVNHFRKNEEDEEEEEEVKKPTKKKAATKKKTVAKKNPTVKKKPETEEEETEETSE